MSGVRLEKTIQLKLKCPVCQETINIKLTQEDFEDSPSGIIRIPLEHSKPYPHLLIVDVDYTGFIRGAYLYKKIAKKTIYSVSSIIEILGDDLVATIMFYLLLRDKVHFSGPEKLVASANQLVELLGEQSKIDKDAPAIDLSKIKRPKAPLYVLRQIVRFSHRLPTNSAKYEWIKGEYNRIKRGLEEVKNLLMQNKKWSSEELLKEVTVNLTKDELRLIIDILDKKGLDASRKMKDTEYKIKELVI